MATPISPGVAVLENVRLPFHDLVRGVLDLDLLGEVEDEFPDAIL